MIVNSPVYNTLVAEETCLVNSMRQFVFKEERGRPVSLDHAELRTAGSFYSLNQASWAITASDRAYRRANYA